jgi:Glycosyl transferases group 1
VEPPPAPLPGPRETVRLAYIDPRPGAGELALLQEALRLLQDEAGGSYTLDVVTSIEPDLGAGWYEWVRMPDPARAYTDYARRLRELRPGWHAAVLPRVTVGDGDLRYLECAALGLPAIHSASEAGTIRDGVEGLVCENRAEAWTRAIKRVTRDAELAQTIRHGAWHDVVTGRLMRQAAPPLLELLGQALEAPVPATAVAHAG